MDNLNRGLPLLPRAATRSFWNGTNHRASRLPDCFCAIFLHNETVAASCFCGFELRLPRPLQRVPSSSCATPKERWTDCFNRRFSRGVFPLSARLAMSSLSEDSSVTEGNGLTLQFAARKIRAQGGDIASVSFHSFFREIRTATKANLDALRYL